MNHNNERISADSEIGKTETNTDTQTYLADEEILNETSNILHDNDCEISRTSTADTLSLLHDSIEKSSDIFSDNDCKAPIQTQCLILDFTPDSDLDNDDVQDKCCAFWDYVNSNQLNKLVVKPEPECIYNNTLKSNDISIEKQAANCIVESKEKTAVSMLQFVEEKDLIRRAFEGKLSTSLCYEELKDYSEELCVSKITKARADSNRKNNHIYKIPKDTRVPNTATVRDMCQVLHEWDLEHPKTVAPPGPVPDLED